MYTASLTTKAVNLLKLMKAAIVTSAPPRLLHICNIGLARLVAEQENITQTNQIEDEDMINAAHHKPWEHLHEQVDGLYPVENSIENWNIDLKE